MQTKCFPPGDKYPKRFAAPDRVFACGAEGRGAGVAVSFKQGFHIIRILTCPPYATEHALARSPATPPPRYLTQAHARACTRSRPSPSRHSVPSLSLCVVCVVCLVHMCTHYVVSYTHNISDHRRLQWLHFHHSRCCIYGATPLGPHMSTANSMPADITALSVQL